MMNNLYHYRIQVVRVIDGDTIVAHIDLGFDFVLKNQHIRLARVNAPELHGESKEQGERSRDALVGKLLGKKVFVRTQKDDKEKYGRLLADIFLEDGMCINDWLLSENLARPYMV
jgi:endonuclease YncB( thermonuclease family)